nr:septal ring lytic transglycosylase RlpA family protein [uncultured Acetobacter sp.]
MSALRRALLGSVFIMASMASVPAAKAEEEQGATAWADSVQRALAAREEQDPTFDTPEAGQSAHAHRFQKGMASWYGGRFHNRRTSSGSLFNKASLTAAHPTAPLGSKLLVTSEETGRSVVVTVNDRGPYSRNRIIDLSQAAAARIGMLGAGVAHVKIEVAPIEVASAPQGDKDSLDSTTLQMAAAQPQHSMRALSRPRMRATHG